MTDNREAELIANLLEDNQRLRRLLDQQDASGELRHRLRNTLALLRAVIRESAHTERDLPDYVNHLGDRLDAISRAQAQADQYGEVSLRTLLLEELFQYRKNHNERLLLSGPDIYLKPKPGQILGLAIHELTVNAVEYGALGGHDGQLEVMWTVDDTEVDPQLNLTWKERGLVIDTKLARRGFGTKVLVHVLTYNLGAEADIVFSADELTCTIKLPLPKQIARVSKV